MISGAIHDALAGMFGGRVYPNSFPLPKEGPPLWPACRYTITGTEPYAALCDSGDASGDDVDVQIDVVARTYGAMVSLKDQVISVLHDFDPPAIRTGYFETKDEETETHRGILLYTFQQST